MTGVKTYVAEKLADDFIFLEAPRWHDGKLWMSDVYDLKVVTWSPGGKVTTVVDVPDRPSGLSFLPDGTPIVASQGDRALYTIVDGSLVPHTDLWELAAGDVNDFVIDGGGRIYVGNFGYDLRAGEPLKSTDIHLVEPDGSVRVAASDVIFPNGAVLMNDERTLVVAETWANRLMAFDRDADGLLVNRRVFADLGDCNPDGICIDAEDGIWVGCLGSREFVRVIEGGEVTARVPCNGLAVACELGGEDGRTLFCSVYAGSFAQCSANERLGELHATKVEIGAPHRISDTIEGA